MLSVVPEREFPVWNPEARAVIWNTAPLRYVTILVPSETKKALEELVYAPLVRGRKL
jgi:hypothetical protein